MKKSPILVTGSHNSGSTWVGKMISLSPDIGYLHEPFNPKFMLCKSAFKYWFTYVTAENEANYKQSISNCLSFEYPLLKELKEAKSLRDTYRAIRNKYYLSKS